MLILVRAVVHIIWMMSTVMDMRLTCWAVHVDTLLVECTTMVLMFITVHLGMRLESNVMVCALTLIPYIRKAIVVCHDLEAQDVS